MLKMSSPLRNGSQTGTGVLPRATDRLGILPRDTDHVTSPVFESVRDRTNIWFTNY